MAHSGFLLMRNLRCANKPIQDLFITLQISEILLKMRKIKKPKKKFLLGFFRNTISSKNYSLLILLFFLP